MKQTSLDGDSLVLYSQPRYQGYGVVISQQDLADGQCVNVGNGLVAYPAQSVEKQGFLCCLLYRSPCPTEPQPHDQSQAPAILNMRVFRNVPDLNPLGFSKIVRSVVCPSKNICNGLLQDKEWIIKDGTDDEKLFMDYWWADVRRLEGHQYYI
ncbi:hypothetical protein QBC46DRAFT_388394 [Diplogelasinospora grovesii]|uniref:Uncharacterized protein n=1 Tax=Diplogelasinospora grovesii TaxID=303347 RepID=A0AAN6N4R9_9PEZI|nr:hypothetical protein QBC46DRAFT_388394 [Diplogelasinospora grovesii]